MAASAITTTTTSVYESGHGAALLGGRVCGVPRVLRSAARRNSSASPTSISRARGEGQPAGISSDVIACRGLAGSDSARLGRQSDRGWDASRGSGGYGSGGQSRRRGWPQPGERRGRRIVIQRWRGGYRPRQRCRRERSSPTSCAAGAGSAVQQSTVRLVGWNIVHGRLGGYRWRQGGGRQIVVHGRLGGDGRGQDGGGRIVVHKRIGQRAHRRRPPAASGRSEPGCGSSVFRCPRVSGQVTRRLGAGLPGSRYRHYLEYLGLTLF